jgi:flagellar hook-basal body complex protein FliE
MRISIPGSVPASNGISSKPEKVESQVSNFSDYLWSALDEVDKLQKEADSSAVALATGEIQNLHQVMIDAEKAEIALQFTIQVRNKIIEAYQEIMRMQV